MPSRSTAVRARNADSGSAREGVEFTTTLAEHGPTGQWPHLFLSRAATGFLGRRGAVAVIVAVNGASFRRTAKPDGKGGHFVLFNADMRERTGAEAGDRVHVALTLDSAPLAVEVPQDLAQVLRAEPRSRAAFDAMTPSHRRAYVEFVEEAVRPETRERRLHQALRMMAQWAVERAGRPRGARAGRAPHTRVGKRVGAARRPGAARP